MTETFHVPVRRGTGRGYVRMEEVRAPAPDAWRACDPRRGEHGHWICPHCDALRPFERKGETAFIRCGHCKSEFGEAEWLFDPDAPTQAALDELKRQYGDVLNSSLDEVGVADALADLGSEPAAPCPYCRGREHAFLPEPQKESSMTHLRTDRTYRTRDGSRRGLRVQQMSRVWGPWDWCLVNGLNRMSNRWDGEGRFFRGDEHPSDLIEEGPDDATPDTRAAGAESELCEGCPPVGYPTDITRCAPCPRRAVTPPTRNPFEGHCCIPRDGEPFFVLLGRDKQAPACVEKWVADREAAKPGDDKIAGALEIAGKMRAYSGAPTPPAAQASEEEVERAWKAILDERGGSLIDPTIGPQIKPVIRAALSTIRTTASAAAVEHVLAEEERYLIAHVRSELSGDGDGPGIMPGDVEGAFCRIRSALNRRANGDAGSADHAGVWEEFGRRVLAMVWEAADLEGNVLADEALKLGLVEQVEFDPEKHGDIDADDGDLIYRLKDEFKRGAKAAPLVAISAERLAEIEAGAKAATPGPWKVGPFASDILAPSEKGGETKLFDIRGWGYFTGQGHGALGLTPDEGRARQAANGAHVAGLDPQTALALVAEIRSLARRLGEAEHKAAGLQAARAVLEQERDEAVRRRGEPDAWQWRIPRRAGGCDAWATVETDAELRAKVAQWPVTEVRPMFAGPIEAVPAPGSAIPEFPDEPDISFGSAEL